MSNQTFGIQNKQLKNKIFNEDEEHPNWGRTRHVRQFEGNVVTDSELEINMKN
jgi:hypothetical protein